MLTRVTIENFRSFKNKTVLDLTATKYQALQETHVKNGVLRGAMLVGPNASGKSTVIVAIRTLLDMLFAERFSINTMHSCLFCAKNKISLGYEFVIGESPVNYLFEVDKKGTVVFEKLSVNNVTVLERKGLTGSVSVDGKEVRLSDNMFTEKVLLLRKCYFSDMFAGDPVISELMDFLRNSVYVNADERIVQSYNDVDHIIDGIEDDGVFDEINKVCSDLGLGFGISKAKKQNVGDFMQDGRRGHYVIRSDEPIVFFKRDDMDLYLPLDMESTGNQTLANIIPAVIYCCKTNCLLLIDEFGNGLHNRLAETLVKFILTGSDKPQLIFTSHSTNLMSTRLLRPDQIYTVSFKVGDGSTIERFSDENPREAQNLEKMYLSGKFGAVPDYKI